MGVISAGYRAACRGRAPNELVTGHEGKVSDSVIIVEGMDVTMADAAVRDGNANIIDGEHFDGSMLGGCQDWRRVPEGCSHAERGNERKQTLFQLMAVG